MSDQVSLEPALGDGTHYFYPKPNPAMTELLVSLPLREVTAEWTGRVGMTFIAKLQGRKHRDDEHISRMENSVDGNVFIGGYEMDRWIGQIVVGVPYALADEFGRHTPAEGQNESTYDGSGDLRASLYENLPEI